jgi:dienelactone hydrolase
MHDCCRTGHIHTGTPVGSITQIAGRDTYVTRNAQSNGRAVLFIHDAFGITFVNNQLLADTFAEQAQVDVYIPDFFDGDAIPVSVMTSTQPFDWAPWRAKHGRDVYPMIEEYTKTLREEQGIKKLVAIGYCWGAMGTIRLGATDLIDGAAVAHPSFLDVPGDIEKLKKPSLFLCAEVDHAFPVDKRTQSQQILEQRSADATFKLFEGVSHGFAVRFNGEDKVAAAAAEEAKDLAVQFFKRIL